MSANINSPVFQDKEAAREYFESIRWPNGPVCPHCGNTENIRKLQGKSTRPGVYRCNPCKRQFTVTVGTAFESSHIPLNKWLLASYLLCSSKKGMSSHQLHRMLGVTYKTAWFMTHRIREAFREGKAAMLGANGGVVEADETYFGHKADKNLGKRTKRGKRGHAGKRSVVALVERGGSVRTFHPQRADKVQVSRILRENVSREAQLMTDESRLYDGAAERYADHQTVHHSSGQYVRRPAVDGAPLIHSNTVEGYFSIFKRGMRGIYQHCGEKHLHRYLREFDFRYNHRRITDWERTALALSGAEGKRLVYGGTDWPQPPYHA